MHSVAGFLGIVWGGQAPLLALRDREMCRHTSFPCRVVPQCLMSSTNHHNCWHSWKFAD